MLLFHLGGILNLSASTRFFNAAPAIWYNENQMLMLRRCPVFLLLILFLTGCVDIDLKTTIHTDGSGTQTWRFTTTALLASQIKKQIQNDPLFGRNKTRFSDEFKEGDYILSAAIDFKDVSELQARYRNITLDKTGILRKTYTYTETWKQNVDDNGIIARNAGGLVPVTIKVAVEMPGRIVDSNAQTIDGRIARWNLPVNELIQPKTFRVVSRRWNLALLVPALLVVCGLIASIILFVVLGAKKPELAGAAGSIGQKKCATCQSVVPPGSLFCNVCGAKLN